MFGYDDNTGLNEYIRRNHKYRDWYKRKKIYPEIIFRVYDNGDLVLHDVTSLDRLPNDGSLDHRLGRHVKPSQVVKQPSDNIILPQTTDNVKVLGQIEGYYKKCGDDF